MPFVGHRNDVPQAEEHQPEEHRCFEDLQKRTMSLLLSNAKARLRSHDVKPSLIVFLMIILSLF